MKSLRPKHSTINLLILLVCALVLGACKDGTGISVARESPDAGCNREEQPHTYTVYFVLDVSGSMGVFLTDLRRELQTFVENFPEFDEEGRRVQIDFYLIAFVNDIKHFGGGRMTSVIALQDAFESAIVEGSTDYNLNVRSFNAEQEENMLDALGEIFKLQSTSEAQMVILATDAPFTEHPNFLNEGIQVQHTYAGVLEQLSKMNARVHAFTNRDMNGITREYMHQPPLTSIPGSTVHRLNDLTGAGSRIRETLGLIARNASCQ